MKNIKFPQANVSLHIIVIMQYTNFMTQWAMTINANLAERSDIVCRVRTLNDFNHIISMSVSHSSINQYVGNFPVIFIVSKCFSLGKNLAVARWTSVLHISLVLL